MYFGVERKRTYAGKPVKGTSYSVNNIYLNGIRIAAVIPDGSARYYLTDQIDSLKVVFDDSGEAVTRFEYLPYGEAWFTEKTGGVEEEHSPRFDQQDVGSV